MALAPSEKIVSETETHVYTERTVTCSYEPFTKVGKYQKYLCIGGPFNRTMKAEPQLDGTYIPFNRGTNLMARGVTKETPKRIWIHSSLINHLLFD